MSIIHALFYQKTISFHHYQKKPYENLKKIWMNIITENQGKGPILSNSEWENIIQIK